MSVHFTAALSRKHPLGGYESMSITAAQPTAGGEYSVGVTGPLGALAGDVRRESLTSYEDMRAAFGREVAAARAAGWEIGHTTEDGPGTRHVRTPPAGMR
ncbi:MAG TPA: hypothetical protein VK586_09000 [Streptosporangiaceae bacterium]|nr:hypothetical protein [Streptosporangiaceae bacterium]